MDREPGKITWVDLTVPDAPAIRDIFFATYGEGADLCRVEGGGAAKHPYDPATKPEDLLFHMDGPEVFLLAYREFPPVLMRALADAETMLDDIDLVLEGGQ